MLGESNLTTFPQCHNASFQNFADGRIVLKRQTSFLGTMHLGDEEQCWMANVDVEPYAERSTRDNNSTNELTDMKPLPHVWPPLGGDLRPPVGITSTDRVAPLLHGTPDFRFRKSDLPWQTRDYRHESTRGKTKPKLCDNSRRSRRSPLL